MGERTGVDKTGPDAPRFDGGTPKYAYGSYYDVQKTSLDWTDAKRSSTTP